MIGIRQCLEVGGMAVILAGAVVLSYALANWATELVLVQVVEWLL